MSPRTGVAAGIAPVPELIAKKRDGGELSDDELRSIVGRYTAGTLPDYQMSALAMAIFYRGMSDRETATLTLAMRDSGRVLDFGRYGRAVVDKHSTGGVGDKVSLCLAPIASALGVRLPMISGRGLGHTGGTLDKLESIPGFRVRLEATEIERLVHDVGCALAGQTEDLAPADRRLYALRDVTGTVESIPLITASILSKKLAEGIDGLVLDVKVGGGAFMKTIDDARALAESLVRVGTSAKKRVVAVLTSMDTPLGLTIGNALEAREAIEVLHGRGPSDLVECTLTLAAEMVRLAGIAASHEEARALAETAVRDGRARAKFAEIVRSQGGDERMVDEPDRLPKAPVVETIAASTDGFVKTMDAKELGLIALGLGAGRVRTDDVVDPTVGLVLKAKPGDAIRLGAPLVEVHARSADEVARVRDRIERAIAVARRPPDRTPLVLERHEVPPTSPRPRISDRPKPSR